MGRLRRLAQVVCPVQNLLGPELELRLNGDILQRLTRRDVLVALPLLLLPLVLDDLVHLGRLKKVHSLQGFDIVVGRRLYSEEKPLL